MDDIDDLAAVDPLQVDRGDPGVRVATLRPRWVIPEARG